ncbi:MAG TPA: hypothetical protein VFA68_10765 [Terriglobales bacterium]|nr:hypothetical protein [Terriglobales bacterium]
MATQSFNPNLDWKQAFENALGELEGNEVKRPVANRPIYSRRAAKAEPVLPDQAVASAAEALAALWKTSRAKQIGKSGKLSADGRRPQ